MKKIVYSALLSGSLLFVLSACHKDNNKDVAITFQNLAGTYKVTTVILSDGHTSANFTDSIDVCQKDDLFHFNKDSTFVYEDAGVACTPNGSFTTTWSLKGNVFTTGGGDQGIVNELTASTLILTSVDSSSTPAITTTETFTRQ